MPLCAGAGCWATFLLRSLESSLCSSLEFACCYAVSLLLSVPRKGPDGRSLYTSGDVWDWHHSLWCSFMSLMDVVLSPFRAFGRRSPGTMHYGFWMIVLSDFLFFIRAWQWIAGHVYGVLERSNSWPLSGHLSFLTDVNSAGSWRFAKKQNKSLI